MPSKTSPISNTRREKWNNPVFFTLLESARAQKLFVKCWRKYNIWKNYVLAKHENLSLKFLFFNFWFNKNLYRNGVPEGLGILIDKFGAKVEGHFLNGALVNKVYEASECQQLLKDAKPNEELIGDGDGSK